MLELQFTGLTFKHPLLVGNDIFSITFTQYLHIELGRNKNGEIVLVPTNKDPKAKYPREIPKIHNPSISVTPDKSAEDFQRTMMIIAIAFSILPLGLGIYKAGKWVVGADMAADASAAASAGTAVVDVAVDATQAAQLADASITGTDNLAAAAAMTSNVPVAAGISTLVNRLAMISGFFSAMATIGFSVEKLQHDGDLDMTDAPSLDLFVKNALGASKWPGAKDWALKDARLAKSLLLYGELKT